MKEMGQIAQDSLGTATVPSPGVTG
uniref:Uncharacterized protein n=1 Tax=Anguilla anguilla TaxID=7936 RepID=A0A0E9XZJ3_ANGAN